MHDIPGLGGQRLDAYSNEVPGGARGAQIAARLGGWPAGISRRLGAVSRRRSEVRKCEGARAACPRRLPQASPPHPAHRRGSWRSPQMLFVPLLPKKHLFNTA
jgi:hypothetical protein